MGFLERLVTDMIGDSVGFDGRSVRRVTRMVGGKNLLWLAGGAALAGGVASALSQRQGTVPPAAGVAVPPPPPPPPPAEPPPPPPSVQAVPPPPPPPPPPPAAEPQEVEESELPPEAVYAVVRTMVAAALADGSLAPEEKELIHRRLGESGLSQEQTLQIHRDLVLPPTPAELVALAPPGPGREALYRCAALIVLADGQASDLERDWLGRLARALEIEPGRAAALEVAVG
ncbi:MAG TPA: DUF533 domain-containing protein [Thermoanaerobaculia bacterium]|jgi:uncharacterized membrane protein YebE (DUF533 family)